MSLEIVEHFVLVKLSMCQICERCVLCDLWHGQKHVWKSASKMWLVLSRTVTYYPLSSVINLGSDIIIWNQNSNHVSESRKVSHPPNKFCTAPSFGKVQIPPPSLKGTTVQQWIPGKQNVWWVPCRGTKNGFAEYCLVRGKKGLRSWVNSGFWFEVGYSHITHKLQCQQ